MDPDNTFTVDGECPNCEAPALTGYRASEARGPTLFRCQGCGYEWQEDEEPFGDHADTRIDPLDF